jgi:hypothetical protein
MDLYTLLKIAHVIGATVLLGTGAGIAFFMLMAHRARDPALIAHTAGIVVLADTVFTALAVILQPVTGAGLAHLSGYPLLSGWVAAFRGSRRTSDESGLDRSARSGLSGRDMSFFPPTRSPIEALAA